MNWTASKEASKGGIKRRHQRIKNLIKIKTGIHIYEEFRLYSTTLSPGRKTIDNRNVYFKQISIKHLCKTYLLSLASAFEKSFTLFNRNSGFFEEWRDRFVFFVSSLLYISKLSFFFFFFPFCESMKIFRETFLFLDIFHRTQDWTKSKFLSRLLITIIYEVFRVEISTNIFDTIQFLILRNDEIKNWIC